MSPAMARTLLYTDDNWSLGALMELRANYHKLQVYILLTDHLFRPASFISSGIVHIVRYRLYRRI